jgi:phosphatidylinositol glycan class B
MLSKALVLACIVRSATLFLPHTFFQPDEFYQAFEPAYTCVFGGGYLTWEWRDLPVPLDAPPNNWWTSTIVGGRLRGWIWPGVFMLVYRLVRSVGWEETDLIVGMAHRRAFRPSADLHVRPLPRVLSGLSLQP